MAAFPGGTVKVVDRTVYPAFVEYTLRVTPTGASEPWPDMRVQANGTIPDLRAKGKAAILAYLASLTPPPDNIPVDATLAVAPDGTLS